MIAAIGEKSLGSEDPSYSAIAGNGRLL